MKKIVTVVIIVLLAIGFGYFLFKISPQEKQEQATSNFKLDASGVKQISLPGIFDATTDRYQGDVAAKNVFIEYSDYQCPACAAYARILKAVPTTFKDTVFVYRYFPLEQIHKNGVEAALAAEAAGAQGKYWEMHDILFQKQTDWQSAGDPLDLFAQYAQSIGVSNIDQFKSDVTNKKYISRIEKDNNEALGLSLPGTPSFFFNGHSIKNDTLDNMKKEAEPFLVK